MNDKKESLERFLGAIKYSVEEYLSDVGQPLKAEAPTFLTVGEACAFLKVSKSKLYHLAKEGRIKRYRVGACVRFRQSDLLALYVPES